MNVYIFDSKKIVYNTLYIYTFIKNLYKYVFSFLSRVFLERSGENFPQRLRSQRECCFPNHIDHPTMNYFSIHFRR